MVNNLLLEVGVAIIVSSIGLMSLGLLDKTHTDELFGSENRVRLPPQGQPDSERRMIFHPLHSGKLRIAVSDQVGQFDMSFAEAPATLQIKEGIAIGVRGYPLTPDVQGTPGAFLIPKVRPVVSALVLRNTSASTAATCIIQIHHDYAEKWLPHFWDIGVQILVVGIPLVITSLLS